MITNTNFTELRAYIYIYIQREREREREINFDDEIQVDEQTFLLNLQC